MSWYGEALAGWYRSKIASADAVEQGISSFGTAIGKAIEESRQNSIANQIGSQEANSGAYAPRAALVAPGSNPDMPGTSNYIPSSVPTGGTAPAQFTGGYKGLQLQTAIDSLKRQNANTASEIALRQNQGDYYKAHTDVIQENADTERQRANTYRDKANRPPADTIQKLNTELADTYGKAAPAQILGALQKDPTGAAYRGDVKTINGQQVWVPNPQGTMFSPNAPAPDPEDKGWFGSGLGGHAAQPKEIDENTIQVPWKSAQQYMNRYKNITNNPGNGGQGATTGGGNQLAVTTPLSPDQARAMVRSGQLKPGDWFPGTDGMSYQVPPTQP